MKPLMCIGIFGLLFPITLLVLTSNYSNTYGQVNEDNNNYEMILINQKYTSNGFVNEITGEILNNGTNTAKGVEISAIFYNDSGIVGFESDGTSPSTISAGDRSTFTLEILDPVIQSDAERYEFTIKWQDESSSDNFLRLAGGEITDDSGGDDSGGDDSGGDDSGGDDSGGDDNSEDEE